MRRPVALTIATSDSGGGAGVQADLKTMEACGVFGTSVLAATTAQNTRGVDSVHVLPIEEIDAQLDAVLEDFAIGAAKTGMLATAAVVETVAERAASFSFPLVVDPVMVAASGDRLLEPEGEAAYEHLIAEATLVTPNADETTVLTDIDVKDERTAIDAGEAIVDMGADAALIKGGHVPGETVADVLVTPEDTTTIDHPRIETEATHGSGCTLASAIAARLAHGAALEAAVADGIELLSRAVRYPIDVGEGPGVVHHLVDLRERAARQETAEAVAGVVEEVVARDASPLVPEVGMNVVGATPYAERTGETAAVEGRITRTFSGIQPNRGVRFGASSHVARFLLSAREAEPALQYALNCRFDADVEDALGALDGPVGEYDRSAEPEDVKRTEGSTMEWGARQVFGGNENDDATGRSESESGETPVAVIDRGEVGKEALTKIVASDPDTLVERSFAVLDALEDGPIE